MAISRSKVLASLLNGELASKIAQQASMKKDKEVEFSSIAGDDDASDEELSMVDTRKRAKAVSQEVVGKGRLPKRAQRQETRKSPFSNIVVLSNAFELLGKLTRQASKQPAVAKKSLQRQRLEDARASVEDVHAANASPRDDSKTATSDSRSFRMDAAEEDGFGDAAARESSLARSYDVLGANHYALDDGSDTDCCGTSRRTSSITRGYDALVMSAGQTAQKLPPVRPPSRGAAKSGFKPPSAKALLAGKGDVAPVRSPSRGAAAIVRKSLCAEPAAAPSAMDLDLENTTLSQQPQATSIRQLCNSTRSQSLGSVRLSPQLASGKNASAALPPVPGARGVGGVAFSSKSGPVMKTGSAHAALWDVPSSRSAMALHNRRAIF
jgi:hypothetical protein